MAPLGSAPRDNLLGSSLFGKNVPGLGFSGQFPDGLSIPVLPATSRQVELLLALSGSFKPTFFPFWNANQIGFIASFTQLLA